MANQPHHPPTTADLIQSELADRGIGIRALARVLAGGDPVETERWRRALYRYLRGSIPSPEQAALMEERLGKPAGYFPRFDSEAASAAQGLRVGTVALLERHEERLETLREIVSGLVEHVSRHDDQLSRQDDRIADAERRIADLERHLGRREPANGG